MDKPSRLATNQLVTNQVAANIRVKVSSRSVCGGQLLRTHSGTLRATFTLFPFPVSVMAMSRNRKLGDGNTVDAAPLHYTNE